MVENYTSVVLTVVREMVVLTVVRPKSVFGRFDRCATRNGLKKVRLMAGFHMLNRKSD